MPNYFFPLSCVCGALFTYVIYKYILFVYSISDVHCFSLVWASVVSDSFPAIL